MLNKSDTKIFKELFMGGRFGKVMPSAMRRSGKAASGPLSSGERRNP